MNVSTLVNQYYSNQATGSKVQTKEKGVEKLVQKANALSEGQIFEGTVSSVKGSRVTLSLSNGQFVDARIQGKVSLSEGQSVFFEVKSSSDTMIEIRPVSTNALNNPTLLDALNSAGLQVNEKNLQMVNDMMRNEMPINSSSLNEMARELASLKNADVASIVALKNNGLPLTDEMVEQLKNFKSEEGAVGDLMNEISDSIPDMLLSENVSTEEALGFLSDFNDILNGNSSLNKSSNINPENVIISGNGNETEVSFSKEGTIILITDDFADDGETVPIENIDVASEALSKDIPVSDKIKGSENSILNNQFIDGENIPSDDNVFSNEKVGFILPAEEDIENLPNDSILKNLSENSLKDISSLLDNLKDNEAVKNLLDENNMIKETVTDKDLMSAILKAIKDSPDKDASLLKMLKNQGFKALIKETLSNSYSLEPSKIKDSLSVKAYFKKTATDMSLLKNFSDNLMKTSDNPVSKAANLIESNINFQNEVNQNLSFIQLPIRLSNQNATTDLYVYTNKKNGRAEDDEVTAFLHFDLDHLGSTDIAIRMRNKNVDTKFFMEDDESYELIKNNMHILEKRLKNLGYSATIDIENDSKKHNIVTDVLEKDVHTGGNIHRYSFDVRA